MPGCLRKSPSSMSHRQQSFCFILSLPLLLFKETRQIPGLVTIGILAIEPWPPLDTFRRALDDLGYIEGKNVRFEYRYAKGHNKRLPAQELADMACNRITAAITRQFLGERRIIKKHNPYNHTGSTRHVRFNTSRADRWDTSGPPPKNHVNWVVLDSDWESEFCRVAESHSKVIAYTKNHNLGLEVPYRYGSETRKYLPDFIVLVDEGHGPDDPLHLVVDLSAHVHAPRRVLRITSEQKTCLSIVIGRKDLRSVTEISQGGLIQSARPTRLAARPIVTQPPSDGAFLCGLITGPLSKALSFLDGITS